MQLLVSVRDAAEARAALDGGADIIDAKEPAHGALGAVELPVLVAIRAALGEARPTSAALGDAADLAAVDDAARRAAELGLAYVKLGFRGERDATRATKLLAAAVRGARAGREATGVIAVAYADARCARSLPPLAMLDVAADAGARGVLLDTACKAGDGLLGLLAPAAIARWVDAAHERALTVALAGKLDAGDLATVRPLGADVVGVRGAACDGGRAGRISAARVRALASALR